MSAKKKDKLVSLTAEYDVVSVDCKNCGEDLKEARCTDCGDTFGDGDLVYCIETDDGNEHTCKDCYLSHEPRPARVNPAGRGMTDNDGGI